MKKEKNIHTFPLNTSLSILAKQLKISNFSQKTIKAYIYYNKELLKFANKSAKKINRQDIFDYLDFLLSQNKSVSTLNIAISAFKNYYNDILRRKFFISAKAVRRPKKEKKLPVVLSKNEILRLIKACSNLKHKLVIKILYTSGLRVAELANLKIKDIDFDRKQVFVKRGKGKKDRISIIAQKTLDDINEYRTDYNPVIYLLENKQGLKMTTRSLQKIVSFSAQKAKIKKSVSAHVLRHSFATHLLEAGVSIRYIQALLGHARLETTQIYTKVADSNFKNIKDLL